MLDGSTPAPTDLLAIPPFLLLPALIATMAADKRARAASGRPILAERPGLWLRRALLVGPQLVVLGVVLVRGDLASDGEAEWCLLLAALLAWLSPGSADAVLGETGVRRGWFARRFEDLEEWRLTGDHLRFRRDGEWTSVPCPPAQHVRVREMLLAANAAAESRFQD
ncbi:MAG TPA: hypothetical protein VGR31_00110 [Planctomycetota bacterium]|nr:hypothetical protein [Planctomycetota bacterium]